MTLSPLRDRKPERDLPSDGATPAHADGHAGGGLQSVLGNQRFQRRLSRQTGDEGGPLSPSGSTGIARLEGLIVHESAAGPDLGGMRKGAFLKLLESEVTRGAEAELRGTGRTTEGCPWIAYWFRYYERRDTAHLARAIEKYAPEAALAERPEDVVALVRDRVRGGVRRSLRSGTIEDLPPGIPLEAFAPGSEASVPVGEPPTDPFGLTPEPARGESASVAATTHSNDAAEAAADAGRAELGLGAGEPLDARTRSRMESAFRTDLSDVRLHSDAAGQTAAGRRNAQAFAYGSDIAMAPGRHGPGTPTGDALLAHEIAHVIQQGPAQRSAEAATRGPTPQTAPASVPAAPTRAAPRTSGTTTASAPLEADADRSATGVMRALWGGGAGGADAGLDTQPARRSALQVASCGGKTDDPTVAKSVDVKPITMFESTGNPTTDITFGNTSVWNQANLTLSAQPTQTVDQTETERLIGSDHTVDTITLSQHSPDESALLSQFASDSVIPLIYVKEVEDTASAGLAGETVFNSCGGGRMIAVENGLSSQGVNHEIGHALGLEHKPSDATNLMFPTEGVTNTSLDPDQITTVRTSDFAH